MSGSRKMDARFSGPASDAEEVPACSSRSCSEQYVGLRQPLTGVFMSEMSGLLAEQQLRTSISTVVL